jgi:hypothetical protein
VHAEVKRVALIAIGGDDVEPIGDEGYVVPDEGKVALMGRLD